jgi:acyl transferase domain-containing protein
MKALKRMAGVALVATLGAAACQVDDGPRYRSDEGHFSMVQLDGWSATHERDAVVFYGDDEEPGRASIAIRSVPRTGDWVEERTPSGVTVATKTALQGLPGAQLSSQRSVSEHGMTGMVFELSFEPRGRDGARYERTHVVLVGKGRVFHILHTAPEGALGATAQQFDAVVTSFREEA